MVGVIPGPKEPYTLTQPNQPADSELCQKCTLALPRLRVFFVVQKKTINSYLTPLVLELQEAWRHGFSFLTPNNQTVHIKLCVSCATCDIPANRKVCGFVSHNAALGCNKCLKKFEVKFGQLSNFSGYNRDSWQLRSKEQHKSGLEKIQMEHTKTGLQAAESKFGVRYSVLMSLPYYDPVRFTAIDTMRDHG